MIRDANTGKEFYIMSIDIQVYTRYIEPAGLEI